MGKKLHIVAFDVPYPPHYGGAVEVFFKIKALAELGASIHLHCFLYRDRKPAPELEKYCEQVSYYRRRPMRLIPGNNRPFIVNSRQVPQLLHYLQKNDLPILFEGIHTGGFINHPSLQERLKLVRMHNIEWQYYRHLAAIQPLSLKKIYLKVESRKLKRFEPLVLEHADRILAISPNDQQYFESRTAKSMLIPAFHGCPRVEPPTGTGTFALFHGNLSVADNEKAAIFLIREVFHGLDYPLVIAGNRPSGKLKRIVRQQPQVRLLASPDEKTMRQLLQKAQVNVLWTYQADGIKIKLLRTLHQGRHCIVNPAMVAGTGLDDLCRLANSSKEVQDLLTRLMPLPLTAEEISLRKSRLKENYDDHVNASKILDLLPGQD